MNKATRDIFICHASGDKKEIVSSIVEACVKSNEIWGQVLNYKLFYLCL